MVLSAFVSYHHFAGGSVLNAPAGRF